MSDVIKLHDLRPAKGANKAKTRVGRGEGSKGKTAGRGTKGTKARKQVSAAFEGGQMPIHMRLPKLKGFKSRNKVIYQVVNVGDLGEAFPAGGDITVADIVAKGLVRKNQPETAPAQNVYYPNCKAAKAAGAAPLYQGEPGYRAGLDRDQDGVACER